MAALLFADRQTASASAQRLAEDLAAYAALVEVADPHEVADEPAGPLELEAAALRLGRRLTPLLQLPPVAEVAALDSAGAVIWRGGDMGPHLPIAETAAAIARGEPWSEVADGSAVAAAPLPGGGAILVRVDAARAPGDFAAVAFWAAAFAVLVLLIAPMVVILARRLAAPLEQLAAFVETASVERPGARLDLRTGDEIERVAAGVNQIIGRLEAAMRRIRRLAFYDTVTELPNEEWFQRQIKARLAMIAANPAQQSAVVLLRTNRIAQFAESLGQDAAQELLALAARRVAAAARTADRVVRREASETAPCQCARTGANEFGVLVPDLTGPADAGRFAQLIASALSQPVEWRGQRLSLDCASGVALLGVDSLEPDAALRQARLALRAAKEDRRPVRFFTRALDRDANQRFVLESEMREGLERGQFRALFQPKVDLANGRIVGAEALARWIRPDQSVVGPGVFIPAAEENGLIGKIADAILKDACRVAAYWAREGRPAPVAVNVSALQFADDRFAPRVLAALEQARLPPELLELEITESVAMTNVDRVLHLIEPLRAANVSFAIDDFGTGHSSLASLTRLPFDVLKIDQSFVRGINRDKSAQVIIETILAMSASLNFKTVAEGVETEEEAMFLRLRGCSLAQGFLFGAPMSAEDMLELLLAGDASVYAA